MNDVKIFEDVDALMNALAMVICDASIEAINARGRFNFVLSGGSSPKRLYELLASKTFKDKIDWKNTYFFFGDERYIPENDSRRNSQMVNLALFEPLKIHESHIFKVETTGSPVEAAKNYDESIVAHFKNEPVEFDYILLGLGDNAHTASLFPNTSVLDETEATIKAVFVKEVDMYRITMTAPLIIQAKHIAFLVYGIDKAEAVFQVLEGTSGSSQEYPGRLITLDKNKVQWFLDTAAASNL